MGRMIDLSDLPEGMRRQLAVMAAAREWGDHELWGCLLESFSREALAMALVQDPELAAEVAVTEEYLPVLMQADPAGTYDGQHLHRLEEAVDGMIGALTEREGGG